LVFQKNKEGEKSLSQVGFVYQKAATFKGTFAESVSAPTSKTLDSDGVIVS